MIVRIKTLAALPKDVYLVPVDHRMTFSQARKLIRSDKTTYYYPRIGKFPPLIFTEGFPVDAPEETEKHDQPTHHNQQQDGGAHPAPPPGRPQADLTTHDQAVQIRLAGL